MDTAMTRLWEVDLVRGWAVVLMVLFHLAFDLSYSGAWSIDIHSGAWPWAARLIASTFLVLVGVSPVSYTHLR
ncbi:MAG: heparan-alpha-glucosaminide N-acetyltransferase domain-containing protein, partial [Methanothrix sp.]|nr:heparan-alpha-glucosaminide N-acetyltransferase domain-containing protein [Methanothrix sp.]